MTTSILEFIAIGLLGAAAAWVELISRYRDAPSSALLNLPSIIYILINAGAAVAGLAVVQTYGLRFGMNVESDPASLHLTRILIALLGAMFTLRASLLSIRAGDQDVSLGPAALLQIVREASDRSVDRLRARLRAEIVSKTMDGIDFKLASRNLPQYCLALAGDVSEADQVQLLQSVRLLDQSDTDDSIKVWLLGQELMNIVGPDIVVASVESLRDKIEVRDSDPASPVTPAVP